MAFLCPVRIRRNKRRKGGSGYASEGEEKVVRPVGLGRITGSASIETLVRVGLEKEAGLSADSKMVVLQDFTPCVDDELEVKRGSVVNVLYQENDWVYVIADNGQKEGFIPQSYCASYASQLGELTLNHKKKMPRERAPLEVLGGVDADHNTTIGTLNSAPSRKRVGQVVRRILHSEYPNQSQSAFITESGVLMGSGNESYGAKLTPGANNRASDTSLQSESTQPDIHPFFKNPAGRYIVLYTFIARDENDVSVERGEFVTVLNREDPDWFWVVRSDGQEGFVPSGFVYPADVIQDHQKSVGTNQNLSGNQASLLGGSLSPHPGNYGGSPSHHISPQNNEDTRLHGSELVMLYDYKPQAPDDLSVRRGEWIYADLSDQTVDGWLWAYAPKTRKHGFIPKAYARIPHMTSL